jgi:hypothetical protein
MPGAGKQNRSIAGSRFYTGGSELFSDLRSPAIGGHNKSPSIAFLPLKCRTFPATRRETNQSRDFQAIHLFCPDRRILCPGGYEREP